MLWEIDVECSAPLRRNALKVLTVSRAGPRRFKVSMISSSEWQALAAYTCAGSRSKCEIVFTELWVLQPPLRPEVVRVSPVFLVVLKGPSRNRHFRLFSSERSCQRCFYDKLTPSGIAWPNKTKPPAGATRGRPIAFVPWCRSLPELSA